MANTKKQFDILASWSVTVDINYYSDGMVFVTWGSSAFGKYNCDQHKGVFNNKEDALYYIYDWTNRNVWNALNHMISSGAISE